MAPLLRVCAGVAALVFAAALAIAAVQNRHTPRPIVVADVVAALDYAFIVGSLGALLFYTASRLFAVRVGDDGLHCADTAGRPRTTAWHDVVAARPVSFIGLRYLELQRVTPGAPIALPLFLGRRDEFVRAVEARAGASSVLAQALREALATAG